MQPSQGTIDVYDDSDDDFVAPSKQSTRTDSFGQISSSVDKGSQKTQTNEDESLKNFPPPTTIGNIQSTKPFVIERLFDGAVFHTNDLKEVRQGLKEYATKNGFEIGTSNKTDIADKPGCRRLVMLCSLGDASQKKKALLAECNKTANRENFIKDDLFQAVNGNIVKQAKTRKSSSLKCGCDWAVTVRYFPEEACCRVTKYSADHTNGCRITPAQHAAVRARRGDTYKTIPLALAVTLRCLLRSRAKPTAIRNLIWEHKVIPDTEPIPAHALINLKMKFAKMNADLEGWEKLNFVSPLSDLNDDDRKTIARFAREWVKDCMNEDNGNQVIHLLQDLKSRYPGFQYRIAHDEHKLLSAWMFMTVEMQYFAKTFGQTLFLDWMKSGVSDVDWPYQGPVVLDEENSIHLVAHVLACVESSESYKFALTSMTAIVPELNQITVTTMSDRLAPESVFFECLHSLRASCLCNWHLRVQNLAEWVKFDPNKSEILEFFQHKLQEADVEPEEFLANAVLFKERYGGRAAVFYDSIEHEKHRWAKAYTRQHLLLFKTGNSVGESGNASIDAFMNDNKPHHELVQTLLQYESQQNNKERRRLEIMTLQLPGELKLMSNEVLKQCRSIFSDFITCKFEEQLQETAHYNATQAPNEIPTYHVSRKEFPDKVRLVQRPMPSGNFVCSCLLSANAGLPCRHILCCFSMLGEPLFQQQYFHSRWERRFTLPCSEELYQQLQISRPSMQDKESTNMGDMSDRGADDVEFALDDAPGGEQLFPKNNKRQTNGTKLEANYNCILSVSKVLAELVAPSSQLTEVARNAINVIISDVRAGKVPDIRPSQPMFQSVDDEAAVSTNGKELRMPGPPKRCRILMASEKHKGRPAKRKKTQLKKNPKQCRTCSGSTCSTRFCLSLAAYGKILKPDQFQFLLAANIDTQTVIMKDDFTDHPFQKSWEFVIVDKLYKDKFGFKFVKVTSLDAKLNPTTHGKLYTMTALSQWVETKPKRKLLLLRHDILELVAPSDTQGQERVMLKIKLNKISETKANVTQFDADVN